MTSADRKKCAKALCQALIPDPFYQAMEASVASIHHAESAMLNYFLYSMKEGEEYGLLKEIEDRVGASVWSKPIDEARSEMKSAQKKHFIRSEMGETSLALYNGIAEEMTANANHLVDKHAWYLSILGVAPNLQGRGFGKALVNPVLSMLDELNTESYLETFTPNNIAFYQTLGFEKVGHFGLSSIDASYTVIARKPIKGK